jgi:hypothetical protein
MTTGQHRGDDRVGFGEASHMSDMGRAETFWLPVSLPVLQAACYPVDGCGPPAVPGTHAR